MFGACMQTTHNWFAAIERDDMSYVRKNVIKFYKSRDSRETNVQTHIFRSFNALMYAAYHNNVELLELMIGKELSQTTEELVKLYAPGIGYNYIYKLDINSNALAIALVRKSVASVRCILKYLKENDCFQLVSTPNASNLYVLQTAALCCYPESQLILKNEALLMQQFLKIERGDLTLQFIAGFFGRVRVAETLRELYQKGLFCDSIKKMFDERDSGGHDCFQLCDQEIDYQKFGSSEGSKSETRRIFAELKEMIRAGDSVLRQDKLLE